MTRAYIPDEALRDARFRMLPGACIGLHLMAVAWSVNALTEGHLPPGTVATLLPVDAANRRRTAERLVDAGMWERLGRDEYRVVFLMDAQRTPDQIRRTREDGARKQRDDAERQSRHRHGDHSMCTRCRAITGQRTRQRTRSRTQGNAVISTNSERESTSEVTPGNGPLLPTVDGSRREGVSSPPDSGASAPPPGVPRAPWTPERKARMLATRAANAPARAAARAEKKARRERERVEREEREAAQAERRRADQMQRDAEYLALGGDPSLLPVRFDTWWRLRYPGRPVIR
jgi:hypothetical protein